MKNSKSIYLGIALILMMSVGAWAHNGVTVFMPEIPDPAAMTIDGSDADCGWIDPAWATTSDGLRDYAETWGGNTATHDVLFYTAWSPPPDNSFYFFARVFDDTLRIGEEEAVRWWNDDMLQLCFDPDHSGGDFVGTELGHVNNGQRYHIRVLPWEGQNPVFMGQLDRIDMPALAWSTEEPWFHFGWTVLPAGSGHMDTDVTSTYEAKINLWDFYGESPDASVPHIFEPEVPIHAAALFDDGDGAENGQKHILMLEGQIISSAVDGNEMADYVPLDTAEQPTAVEYGTWGRIKATLEKRLD